MLLCFANKVCKTQQTKYSFVNVELIIESLAVFTAKNLIYKKG